MNGCPGHSCMLDNDSTCRWRILCFQREAEAIERQHLVDLSARIDQQLGLCRICGLDVVQLKGSAHPTHVVPVLPIETRQQRAAAANRHRPRPASAVPA